MPSYLICQGTPETREKKAREFLKDHLIEVIKGEKGKILLPKIKEMRSHLAVKPPAGKRKGILILEAQQMNEESQNALLKSLEEPPSAVTFVLTAPNAKLLLPTVVSRCGLMAAETEGAGEANPKATQFLRLTPAKRLTYFEKEVGYDSDSALSFLSELENAWREDLANPKASAALKRTWETKKLLRSPQSNVKITVDAYLLSW
ncbi:MAG: hypothetical protein WEC39_01145 [Patescibacteria group bacterium]